MADDVTERARKLAESIAKYHRHAQHGTTLGFLLTPDEMITDALRAEYERGLEAGLYRAADLCYALDNQNNAVEYSLAGDRIMLERQRLRQPPPTPDPSTEECG